MAPSATLIIVAMVVSIIYTNWSGIKLAGVIGGRPDFIMANWPNSCVAGIQAPGRRWVLSGPGSMVPSFSAMKVPRHLVNRLESGGAVSHSESVLLHFGQACLPVSFYTLISPLSSVKSESNVST